MKIEQNTIRRDWQVSFKGKIYFVNFTYSDGQTLALLNRDYWEIIDDGGEEVCYAMDDDKLKLSEASQEKIINFCIKNFLNKRFEKEMCKNGRFEEIK